MKMKANIVQAKVEMVKFIKANKGTSFVELERLFERIGYDYKGEYVWCNKDNPNIVFWTGWNAETMNMVIETTKEYNIKMLPTDAMMYYIDGKVLPCPIVKKPNHLYKTRHWLPVVFTMKGGN